MDQISIYLPGILLAFSTRVMVRAYSRARRWIQGRSARCSPWRASSC